MKTPTTPQGANPIRRALDGLGMRPLGLLGLVLLLVLPLVPPFNQEYLVRWLIAAALIGAEAVAFDFTSGFINIVNFGFHAFLGAGAYTSALLVVNLGLSPWVGIFAGAAGAALLGFFTGVITLRLRGMFAAVMAWFVGLALMGLATKLVWLTRGPLGLRVPRLFETESNVPYFYVIVAMLVVTYLILGGITRSRMGLAFTAIGQNMEAARTSGINPTYYRIVNWTVSCAMAGWLGGFYAHYYGVLTPDLMSTAKTIEVLAIAYIGGRGSLWGGAVVAFPFICIMETIRSGLSNLPGLHLILYGLLLIVIMIYYPGGVAQFYRNHIAASRNRFLRSLTGRLTADPEAEDAQSCPSVTP